MAREFGAILCPAEENLVTLFYSTTYIWSLEEIRQSLVINQTLINLVKHA